MTTNRPRADTLPASRSGFVPHHFPSLFAAARRERLNTVIGVFMLRLAYLAVGIALIMIIEGP